MKIFIDTNIIIDVLNKREDFFQDSFLVLQKVFQNYQGVVSTQTITDTVYITRKSFEDSTQQKKIIEFFFESFVIISVSRKEIKKAFQSPMVDFEDAVQSFCAEKSKAKVIVTRNVKDYKFSTTKAMTPEEFLKNF